MNLILNSKQRKALEWVVEQANEGREVPMSNEDYLLSLLDSFDVQRQQDRTNKLVSRLRRAPEDKREEAFKKAEAELDK